ncbi:hypothetical protein IV203_023058 [Nitzschia inconspicua]|uniref:Uncharacterized protein n=1 Tax=Nitzschia inconspicua TaxID=303405 RepID=A0A9K3KCP1_9STRA|nr:hypothetical protein IV203_023058 [Nitzschia inconspicua]
MIKLAQKKWLNSSIIYHRGRELILQQSCNKFTTLFSCKLGCYPHHEVHLEPSDNAQTYSFREYPVPQAHCGVFKEELDQLVENGVLSRAPASKYLSPTFIIPKKMEECGGQGASTCDKTETGLKGSHLEFNA